MKAEKLEAHPEGRERNSPVAGMSASGSTASSARDKASPPSGLTTLHNANSGTMMPGDGTSPIRLMEAVVEKQNMTQAYRRVMSNKGAAGIDEIPVEDLLDYLNQHWSRLKEELLTGSYHPQAVRIVEIPKPSGGIRKLGIPTVIDRLIQQALLQVLTPVFDPYFSESSYGFRPKRSAHDAVQAAQAHVAAGHRWVVDMDLEKFFDRVNHDVLMARLARKITDKRILRLIRRYLQAGAMRAGVTSPRSEGTPQGGPISPLLSNILLDELDKELERRGHRFCRYADDCNIYVRSKAAAERVMVSTTRFLSQKLRLKVNAEKSAVDRPWNRTFLGYSMTHHREPRLKVARKSVIRLKKKLKQIWRQGRGQSLSRLIETMRPVLRGWMAYFRLSEVKGVLEELDSWIRRHLRGVIWHQWKKPKTRAKNLIKRGLSKARAWKSASNGRGCWYNAGASHMNEAFKASYFKEMGLLSLRQEWSRLQSLS